MWDVVLVGMLVSYAVSTLTEMFLSRIDGERLTLFGACEVLRTICKIFGIVAAVLLMPIFSFAKPSASTLALEGILGWIVFWNLLFGLLFAFGVWRLKRKVGKREEGGV